MEGTRWVRDGEEGAPISSIGMALQYFHTRTQIKLTGHPITVYDLIRIKEALNRVNWEQAYFQGVKAQ